MSNCELTAMCMIIDRDKNRVLVQDRVKSWKGINFPGGHVDDGESIMDAAIREVKEETGLMVSDLSFCGIVHWYNDQTKERYMVFHFKTNVFAGDLIDETEEGRVFWVDIDLLPKLSLAEGFGDRLAMFFEGQYIEGFAVWNEQNNHPQMRWS